MRTVKRPAKLRVQTSLDFGRHQHGVGNARPPAQSSLGRSVQASALANKMGTHLPADATGQFEAVMFSELLAQYRDIPRYKPSGADGIRSKSGRSCISLRLTCSVPKKVAADARCASMSVGSGGPLKMVVAAHLERQGRRPGFSSS